MLRGGDARIGDGRENCSGEAFLEIERGDGLNNSVRDGGIE
jgi:hypothetical protein